MVNHDIIIMYSKDKSHIRYLLEELKWPGIFDI
jgi:hypothetical protein